jgi:hypothetical protein
MPRREDERSTTKNQGKAAYCYSCGKQVYPRFETKMLFFKKRTGWVCYNPQCPNYLKVKKAASIP